MMDLIEYGIVGIENLLRKRKQFKDFHAIYFIDSSEESINRLVMEDFSEYR